jgi:hypothetical protein
MDLQIVELNWETDVSLAAAALDADKKTRCLPT